MTKHQDIMHLIEYIKIGELVFQIMLWFFFLNGINKYKALNNDIMAMLNISTFGFSSNWSTLFYISTLLSTCNWSGTSVINYELTHIICTLQVSCLNFNSACDVA